MPDRQADPLKYPSFVRLLGDESRVRDADGVVLVAWRNLVSGAIVCAPVGSNPNQEHPYVQED